MDYPKAIVKEQDPGHEPRLVTFIVFAYNQEELIREAVESAFAQTYEPLEIVLSDDCSTDRTFEIMCEMADVYKGPHTVRVVQNPRNLGVLGHAIARGKDAAGEIVVGAAGDDVSEPERTAMTVDAFGAGGNVGAVFSWVSIIDESGEIIGSRKGCRSNSLDRRTWNHPCRAPHGDLRVHRGLLRPNLPSLHDHRHGRVAPQHPPAGKLGTGQSTPSGRHTSWKGSISFTVGAAFGIELASLLAGRPGTDPTGGRPAICSFSGSVGSRRGSNWS
jgi:hypothetical protein